MPHKVAVVIPMHKETLNEFEKISLAQVQKVLGHYPIIFAVPEGKNFSWIPEGRQIIQMPHLGQGIDHYNVLLVSPTFYEKFLEYEYILIYHLDAFVFSDELEYFCSLGYDNIGAPWFLTNVIKYSYNGMTYRSRIGNGGFSLRKTAIHYNNLILYENFFAEQIKVLPEDVCFSIFGKLFPQKFCVDKSCKKSICADDFSTAYF